MRRIIENSNGHSLKYFKVFSNNDLPCPACSLGKLITRPSPVKVRLESPTFLERIQGDICGPIHPSSGPFRYFMVLIDASTRWSHVCLLSTRNDDFAKLLAQIIKLRAQFPDHCIKSIRLDNAGEFTSATFVDYCMSVGISAEHPVPHVYTQNGLAESFIKRLQLIARPLLLKAKLPTSIWGHVILHAANIIRIRPTSYNQYSPLQLVLGQVPNISHFKIFGSAVYVSIAPPQRSKMGAQRRVGIYVGFDSKSIIRYLEPLTGDLFTARYADCHLDESMFPPLGGDKHSNKVNPDLTWNASGLYFLDPRTGQCKLEVKRIIHMQNIANQIPDAFNDSRNITKSHIPAVNTPTRTYIPIQKSDTKELVTESKLRLKRGRPVGAKDVAPRKRKIKRIAPEVAHAPEEANTPEVNLIKINFDHESEEVLGPEIPYLGAIGALMYLANNTRPDIAFAVNLLARFSSAPMDRHWNGIKHIFRYLRGTIDFGLFFPKNSTSQLIGYADAGYLLDPHFGKSQTGYVFTYCDAAISWKSTKQTTVATSTNHSELIAIHEASRECVWLRSIIKNIQESCGLPDITRSPTVMFEDNTACIDQLMEGYIKGDRTKHISPKFFYTHELQKNGEIDIQQIRSCDNLADLFTKSLPNSTFGKL
ncbi:uncharacterized protein LOC141664839 [Apium graveolens]|uniref:uncharacterized protein LOC141664839 n=1 Tax=Apium graveolens TaxID=4045 RepID=UPI003D7ADF97